MASTYPTSLDVFTNPLTTNPLTAPSHAQQHSDINDAVEALEAKVAIGATVLGTYTAFTPTFGNLTLGNGTLVSYFCRVNKLVHYYGRLTFGTTTVITSGDCQISLPLSVSATTPTGQFPIGDVIYIDASTGTRYVGQANKQSAAFMRLWTLNTQPAYTAQTFISATVPMTWTTSDVIDWNVTYEGA